MRSACAGIVLLGFLLPAAIAAQQGQGTGQSAGQGAGQPATADNNAKPAAPAGSGAPKTKPLPDLTAPRSDDGDKAIIGDIGESSSKATQIDLSAPPDDDKAHPASADAVAEAEAAAHAGESVSEFHAWDPHKAAKDVEVGDYYFKRKNYRGAESRYREALFYKENDAIATLRLAECLEKLGDMEEAGDQYRAYLKIMPHGPESDQARQGLARTQQPSPELTSAPK
jgi:tetratricopeptide (TPR) repeat protein